MKKIALIANVVANVFFFLAGIGILAYALHEFSTLTEWKVTTLFAYSIIMFLLAFRSSLSGFSVFGLKAELREKINEADAVLNDLRNLAKLVLSPTITTVASLGRWGAGFSHKEKYDIKIRAEEVMQSLHMSDKEIDDVLLELHRYNLFDLMAAAKAPALELIKKKTADKRKEHEKRFKGTITDNEGHNKSCETLRFYGAQQQRFSEHLRGYDEVFNYTKH
ncbi:MAG: hypothetical protein HND56_08970 [Pseudomonadota bacterium]|nr:hypothetical protein [Pseudomonadota bacterium]QKK05811.1 MAG: hypothetical protein HND56_08970 [Pseudomonadota bacterium]